MDDRRRLHEPIRFGTAFLWVGLLSLWTFYQGLWFYSFRPSFSSSLSTASAILRTVRPLWFASFFPSLAFGIAWYVFSHRLSSFRTTPVTCGIDRLTISQTYASLCVAICAFTFNYRILPMLPLCTSGGDRASEHLLTLTWTSAEWVPVSPVLEQQVLVGCLAAALIAVQAWGLLPRLGGNRRRLATLVGLLLIGGFGVPWFGLLETLPSPAPKGVFELDTRSPASRGLLLDDSDYQDEANLTLAGYLTTHNDHGDVTTWYQLGRNFLPEWRASTAEEIPYRRCELCQLPGVAGWTLTGLPLKLTGEPPIDSAPTKVIEIPRRPGDARLYDPRSAGAIETVPIVEVCSRLGGSDWVVAKIDFSVSMQVVRDFLSNLRDQGIRRVDLAVIPYGYRTIPSEVAVLSFDASEDTATYTPRRRRESRGKVIIVKKYVPPPRGPIDLRPKCQEVDRWDVYDAWSRYAPDPPNSLPARVRLPVEVDTQYGEFVGMLQGALTGGAEIIVVTVQGNTE